MPLPGKSSYHPYFILAFHLNCLPADRLKHIPRSTRHQWLHKDYSSSIGFDWYRQQQLLFHTLQQVASNKKLLRINLALLRIIALYRFITQHTAPLTAHRHNAHTTILTTLQKVIPVLGLTTALHYLGRPYRWYLHLRQTRRCTSSLLSLCRINHPSQLLSREIKTIQSYCSDPRFLHWPLASVFHQLRRDGAAAFTIATFYKYVSLLGLKRKPPAHRRKNHHTGIRASAPLQLLHADTTLFRTADNTRNFIYLLQDNFSRAILSCRVATTCSPQFTLDNLRRAHQQYLQPAGLSGCQLLTDDGSENAGSLTHWIHSASGPVIRHLIAQRDIESSDSMIEAANKHLKYHFLYRHAIADHAALVTYVTRAVDDYNHRPHHVLKGLSPFDILSGHRVDAGTCRQQMESAKQRRLTENKKEICCRNSF